MKNFLFLLFISFLIHHPGHSTDDGKECCKEKKEVVIDETNLTDINKILSANELTVKQKQKAFEKLHRDESHVFIENLPPEDKKDIKEFLKKIIVSKDHLVPIVIAEGSPILFVNGLDIVDYPQEWVRPFSQMLKTKQLSYYYKWSKKQSLELNRDHLIETIHSLLEIHKDKNLKVVGYSAGGVLSLLAVDKLADETISKRIELHTIAAPVYGYQAPFMANTVSPFIGKSTVQIGKGISNSLTHKSLPNCHHWVTTNCEMDQHTCYILGTNPQLGPKGKPSTLPCGIINTKHFDNESHASVLERAINEIVPVK